MNIGQASHESGVSIKMIRYYEQINLIPPAARTTAGYRHYQKNDLHRLRFIRHARDLGFSMPHIRSLLDLWQDGTRNNAQVRQAATGHIDAMRAHIANLEKMVTTLQTLVDECATQGHSDCPILAQLNRIT